MQGNVSLCLRISMLCLVIVLCVFLMIPTVNSVCGYESCPPTKPGMLNIHFLCHTHDDVGWLYTVDQYYDRYVSDIIRSVVIHLALNETRRFVYVESAFFWRWWNEQADIVKDHVKNLVNDGRLEFLSGGWSMNDEATCHYTAIIDQMTLGLRFLNDTFGKCGAPRAGWQIDPFGHSREQASLFAQMKFDGLFLGRIHYIDKLRRQETRTMEFVWQASHSLGENGQIFTGVLPNVYWPPDGFCFDISCGSEEINDWNLENKARRLVRMAVDQSRFYTTNHTVMTMGMDFHYVDAGKWFRNLDKLINYVNNLQSTGTKVHILYSTPTCYLKALHNENKTWPTMSDEFFPYASNPHEYWTGYYTSRPALKFYERQANSFLQTCKQLSTLSLRNDVPIEKLKRAMGVLQHHDAVTGTEKQHVADDYALRLYEGMTECESAINKAYKTLLANDALEAQNQTFCHLLNISQCSVSEQHYRFWVLAYNPLSKNITTMIRLPVSGQGYHIINGRGLSIQAQMVPIPAPVLSLPERSSLATQEVVFQASIPALGVSTFRLKAYTDYSPVSDEESHVSSGMHTVNYIENEYLRVLLNEGSGLVSGIYLRNGLTIPLKQSFYWYESTSGYRLEKASGAYAFNPYFDYCYPLAENVTYRIVKGPLVEEIHQRFNSWISQVIRLYKSQPHVEFEWLVGPIPVRDHIGKEIITRYDTNLDNNGTFYTDGNGREVVKRVKNHQNTYPFNVTEAVAGNYYPINSGISIRDDQRNLEMTVMTDRAQGGSSINKGSIEIMLHRRTLFDDGFGVSEPLNERGYDGRGLIVRGKHFLTVASLYQSKRRYRVMEKEIFHQPLITLFQDNSTNEQDATSPSWMDEPYHSFMLSHLPLNIHLLTLEKIDTDRVLLRLEHFYEKDEDPIFSQPVNVSLNGLFKPFIIVNVKETTLGANQYLEDVNRLQWKSTKIQPSVQYPIEVEMQYDQSDQGLQSADDDHRGYQDHHPIENPVERDVEDIEEGTEDTSNVEDIENQEEDAKEPASPEEPKEVRYDIEITPMEIRTFILRIRKRQLD